MQQSEELVGNTSNIVILEVRKRAGGCREFESPACGTPLQFPEEKIRKNRRIRMKTVSGFDTIVYYRSGQGNDAGDFVTYK